ncbi:MAG: hypothetical protein FWD57_02410 [Polyangiaceae bacterium]|nr:hypothetical protein [Polyangiaceae bacterium]
MNRRRVGEITCGFRHMLMSADTGCRWLTRVDASRVTALCNCDEDGVA